MYSCFAPLSLLETQRKVTVVLRSAEIRELPQAQPNDAIDQRIGELEILTISHRTARRRYARMRFAEL